MSDLGEIELRERPMMIHEVVAGGRRLTRALYMQMPEIGYIPFPADWLRIM